MKVAWREKTNIKLTVGGNIFLHDTRQTIFVFVWVNGGWSRSTLQRWHCDFELDGTVWTTPAHFTIAFVYIRTKLERIRTYKVNVQVNYLGNIFCCYSCMYVVSIVLNCKYTHAMSRTFPVVVITWAFPLIDVRKDTGARLINADQIVTAWSAVPN